MLSKTCVAFGTFEFVHKGHRKIAEKVVELSKEKGLTSVIVCLEQEGDVFTTEEEKEYLLKQLGVEMVLTFGEIDAGMLLDIVAAEVLVAGANHENLEMIQEAAMRRNVEVYIEAVEEVAGLPVTAERVKKACEESDYELFEKLCGHPYIIIGEVVHGKALGRTKNMPTANIEVHERKVRPKDAVYAARIHRGEEIFDTVTNIGKRPSVDDEDYVTIEALILDFDKEIYGEKLVLEILQYIREVKKFADLDEVKCQIDKDIKIARDCISRRNRV